MVHLIKQLHRTIPRARDDLGLYHRVRVKSASCPSNQLENQKEGETHALMRQPSVADKRLAVSFEPTDDPTSLEVPKNEVSERISAREEATVGRELRLAGVSCYRVAGETLLALCGGKASE